MIYNTKALIRLTRLCGPKINLVLFLVNYNFELSIYAAKRIYRISLYRDTALCKKIYYEILRLNLSGYKGKHTIIIGVKELNNNINEKLKAS